jgi:glucosamine kinase
MTPTLFLGVDGGGTRCRARLETAEGQVLGRGLAGPASMRFGFGPAIYAIMTATRAALHEAGLTEAALAHTYAGIGLAGLGKIGARQALEEWKHPFAGAWFEGDGYMAFLGAFGGEDGGIVIAGTGSIGITFQGQTIRVGGYGFPLSDEGSAADIGLNAIRHALRTLDGRAAPSDFSRELLAQFSEDPGEVLAWAERAASTDYGRLAQLVSRYATQGDAAAVALMHVAGSQIAEIVEALLAKGAPQVALIGGLAEVLTGYMPEAVAKKLVEPQADALAGGILLAKRKLALR